MAADLVRADTQQMHAIDVYGASKKENTNKPRWNALLIAEWN